MSPSRLLQGSTWVWFEFRHACGIARLSDVRIWVTVMRASNRMKSVAVHNVGIFTIQGVCSRAKD